MWAGVTARFRTFHQNLHLTPDQLAEGTNHHSGVRASLNRHYFGTPSNNANSFLIGSWGKGTKTRPPRDVDLYFTLPVEVHQRFESTQGNKQSALLQEVRRVLQATYPKTILRGDGQVVVVAFDRMSVEVVPAFALDNGQYWICDTHNSGRYISADPLAEISHIATTDTCFSGNLRPLVMMMKAWQSYCHVPIKSFWLELVAADYLSQCPWAQKNYFWYDWLARDFLAYLYRQANRRVIVPGTHEFINLGDEWQSRTETAYYRAAKACEYEYIDGIVLAGNEWQKIFGTQIPQLV